MLASEWKTFSNLDLAIFRNETTWRTYAYIFLQNNKVSLNNNLLKTNVINNKMNRIYKSRYGNNPGLKIK